ncbi:MULTISPECIES: SDR family NAD(P)-dependent oxidoreductase [unclassified Peribacillus]|uniref:SDR family NAD(P)-dependent oxidoreductase n=1 Tax=unclassified Peribacillus TaxID=2675266 RepID=UPI001F4DA8AA|nr:MULTISPECIES: SDR family oxidoreductase [unclassified Peribacillus]MCK1986031.1 SDR family oxidoreductase [Peribacillus sp. Aquil_B1]MCK2011254.1 SDR family oxidoreductase [Peribacillus sp. Aquil_B8]
MFDLKGKKAIITGGAQGLGYSMVEAFHNAGVEIAVIDISDELSLISSKLEATEGQIHAIKGNLLDVESLRESFNEALEKLGGTVDILINSAGLIERKPALEFSLESWNRILGLNVTAVFELSRLAAVEMQKQGAGKIINMGSILSVLGGFNAAAYSTSKGAVLQLTKSLSNEWAEYGIQVNAIAPGYMLTTMNTDLMNDPVRGAQVEARIPAKRWGTPEDVAGVALFLAAPASDYVTGTLIPVDGGVLGR